MVCTVSTFPMPSFKILYTYPTILTTIQGQGRSNKPKEIFFSLTGALRAIRNAQGGVLGWDLALVNYMMTMMMVVVLVTMIIMRKNMIVMIMMLDRRQKVHSSYKDIGILKMLQSTKKSDYCGKRPDLVKADCRCHAVAKI